jgi:hypothetical protein
MALHPKVRPGCALGRCVLLSLFFLLAVTATTPVPSVPEAVETAYAIDEDEGSAPRPRWENAPAVAATFLRDSYRPGDTATFVLWRAERTLTLRVFRSGPEDARTVSNIKMHGVPVVPPVRLAPHAAREPISLRVGDWPSGVYFARLAARDGRVGYAPLVVAPKRLGEHRILAVLPTYTWQAYNFRDDDRDGVGDTWYADWDHHQVKLARPFLARGVPPHFTRYDLPFLQWLARTGRDVDYFSDANLDAVSGDALARAYDLIVFPGHHEYVTTREFDAITRYRDLGGNLMFLSANNFFWKTVVGGTTMTRTAKWRDVGRPESALVGVGFIGTDRGVHRGPWIVRDTSYEWLFAGTALNVGDPFAIGGVEIDHTDAWSPRGTRVIAEIPHLFGSKFTAQMTYYSTRSGAKVFATGAFSLARSIDEPPMGTIVSNVWDYLSHP